MPVEESATGVVKVVFGLTPKDNGKFIAVLAPVTVLTCSMMGRSILGERHNRFGFGSKGKVVSY
jgi:hypothetical protein